MGHYGPFKALALRLITKYGTDAVLKRPGATHDPITQTMSGSLLNVPIKVARTKQASQFDPHSLTRHRTVSYVMVIPTNGFTPREGDKIVMGGFTDTIANVEVVDPDGSGGIVAQVRGGDDARHIRL